VQSATAEYRNEQDLVQQFLEEKCEMHVDYSIDKDELYKTWREWCEAAGESEAAKRSKKWLTRQMTNRV
jgi:phage/plasmid-associated DNA primase